MTKSESSLAGVALPPSLVSLGLQGAGPVPTLLALTRLTMLRLRMEGADVPSVVALTALQVGRAGQLGGVERSRRWLLYT